MKYGDILLAAVVTTFLWLTSKLKTAFEHDTIKVSCVVKVRDGAVVEKLLLFEYVNVDLIFYSFCVS